MNISYSLIVFHFHSIINPLDNPIIKSNKPLTSAEIKGRSKGDMGSASAPIAKRFTVLIGFCTVPSVNTTYALRIDRKTNKISFLVYF